MREIRSWFREWSIAGGVGPPIFVALPVWFAANEVNAVAERDATETVAALGHGVESLPAVHDRVVAFDGRNFACATRNGIDVATQRASAEEAARRRHIGLLRPSVD